jgi:hypothetical protein
LFSQRFEAEHLRDAIAATTLAVEKIGTATQLQNATVAAAAALAASNNHSSLQLQAAENHAAIMAATAQSCCDIKATIPATESQSVRDQLQTLQTQLLILTSGSGGHGNCGY